MADSSEEGDAKNGNLKEEAYEYLVRNVYHVGASDAYKRKAQKFVVRGGEMYFKKKKKKGKVLFMDLLQTMEIRLFGVKKEQRRILEACHVDPMSGHMGVKQTLSRISERFPNVTSASMRIGNAFILPQNCTRFQ